MADIWGGGEKLITWGKTRQPELDMLFHFCKTNLEDFDTGNNHLTNFMTAYNSFQPSTRSNPKMAECHETNTNLRGNHSDHWSFVHQKSAPGLPSTGAFGTHDHVKGDRSVSQVLAGLTKWNQTFEVYHPLDHSYFLLDNFMNSISKKQSSCPKVAKSSINETSCNHIQNGRVLLHTKSARGLESPTAVRSSGRPSPRWQRCWECLGQEERAPKRKVTGKYRWIPIPFWIHFRSLFPFTIQPTSTYIN